MDDPTVKPVCPIETTAGQAAANVAWDLLMALRKIKDEQYRWLCETRGTEVIARWKAFEESFVEWRKTADQQIAELGREDGRLRAWLTTTLLSDAIVSDPADYLYHAHTTFGDERIRLEIIGAKPGQRQQSRARPAEADQWSLDSSYVSTLVSETTLDVSMDELGSSLKLSEAMRERLWVSWNQPPGGEGFAYCLTCPCPKTLVSARPLGQADETAVFRSFERYFHTDPFFRDAALRHIRAVHQDLLLEGTPGLLRKYAIHVVQDQGAPLDRWSIAATNFAAQQWHDERVSRWDKLQADYNAIRRLRSWHEPRSQDHTRTVAADAIPGSHVFLRKDSSEAIICPDPDCTEPCPEGPVPLDQVIKHLRSRGIFIRSEEELLYGFSYKVTSQITAQAQNSDRVPHESKTSTHATHRGLPSIAEEPDPAPRAAAIRTAGTFLQARRATRSSSVPVVGTHRSHGSPTAQRIIRSRYNTISGKFLPDPFQEEKKQLAQKFFASMSREEVISELQRRGRTVNHKLSHKQLARKLAVDSFQINEEDELA